MRMPKCAEVTKVRIESRWIGFASPPSHFEAWEIIRSGDGFCAGTASVDVDAVESLLAALAQPALSEPDAANMGVTREWLAEHLDGLIAELFGEYSEEGRERFRKTASDYGWFSQRVLGSFRSQWTDDYPRVRVTIHTRDGNQVAANSSSQHPFMIPWVVESASCSISTYNASIGRGVARLMPEDALNRCRLMGEGLVPGAIASLPHHEGNSGHRALGRLCESLAGRIARLIVGP